MIESSNNSIFLTAFLPHISRLCDDVFLVQRVGALCCRIKQVAFTGSEITIGQSFCLDVVEKGYIW